jgi:N-acetyl-anhydromuramyl-L-alanine amidase AmpD
MLPLFFSLSPTSNKHKDLSQKVDTLIVHRVLLGTTARDIVQAFTGGVPEAAEATDHKMPYHFVVERDGSVHQCLSLNKRGVHARRWNRRSIAVACLGDFRREIPRVAQWQSAVLLGGLLSGIQKWEILGHDEAPKSSSDPNKECPGDLWNMSRYRACVRGLSLGSCDYNDFWGKVRL